MCVLVGRGVGHWDGRALLGWASAVGMGSYSMTSARVESIRNCPPKGKALIMKMTKQRRYLPRGRQERWVGTREAEAARAHRGAERRGRAGNEGRKGKRKWEEHTEARDTRERATV